MHVYQRNRKNSMQGHGTRVSVCFVRHSLRNIPAVSVSHVSGMDPFYFGAPERIDSRHPWRSPCGRLALLDVQIGYPADLSNLSAFHARLQSNTGTHKIKKAT